MLVQITPNGIKNLHLNVINIMEIKIFDLSTCNENVCDCDYGYNSKCEDKVYLTLLLLWWW